MDASEWSGPVGDVWAQQWRQTDRSFAGLDDALIDTAMAALGGAAAPRILDIGCGAGTTTLGLAARLPAATVTGVDLSAALVAVATGRAAETGLTGRCRFTIGDAGRWQAEGDFDLIVSRHGVMFFDDPVAALAQIRGRAAPGAALVFSCFRTVTLNPWALPLDTTTRPPPSEQAQPSERTQPFGETPPPGPFAFADPGRVARLLAAAGWRGAVPVSHDYLYVAGEGADATEEAVAFFRRIGPAARALREAAPPDRARLEAALVAHCVAHRSGDRVVFPAAAWIWRARA